MQADQSSKSIVNRFTPADEVRAGAERLSQVAEQMEQFLAEQIQRIEEYFLSSNSSQLAADQEECARLYEEYQQLRESWENERDEERDRIVAESQRLVDAWKALEVEQRELLKSRVLKSSPSDRQASNVPKNPGIGSTVSQRAQETPVVPAEIPGSSTDSRMPTSRQGPAQFQQLRREMLEHARQKRKR